MTPPPAHTIPAACGPPCLIEVSPHLGMVFNVALIFRQVSRIEPDGEPIELVYQVLTWRGSTRTPPREGLAGAEARAN